MSRKRISLLKDTGFVGGEKTVVKKAVLNLCKQLFIVETGIIKKVCDKTRRFTSFVYRYAEFIGCFESSRFFYVL